MSEMNEKKYASLSSLQVFLDNLKTMFSDVSHTHTIDEITDFHEPTITKITLTSTGWDDATLTQTVSVNGILADTTKQVIHISPDSNSFIAAINSEVYYSSQAENSLTFVCSEIPEIDLIFNVSFQNATYQ